MVMVRQHDSTSTAYFYRIQYNTLFQGYTFAMFVKSYHHPSSDLRKNNMKWFALKVEIDFNKKCYPE